MAFLPLIRYARGRLEDRNRLLITLSYRKIHYKSPEEEEADILNRTILVVDVFGRVERKFPHVFAEYCTDGYIMTYDGKRVEYRTDFWATGVYDRKRSWAFNLTAKDLQYIRFSPTGEIYHNGHIYIYDRKRDMGEVFCVYRNRYVMSTLCHDKIYRMGRSRTESGSGEKIIMKINEGVQYLSCNNKGRIAFSSYSGLYQGHKHYLYDVRGRKIEQEAYHVHLMDNNSIIFQNREQKVCILEKRKITFISNKRSEIRNCESFPSGNIAYIGLRQIILWRRKQDEKQVIFRNNNIYGMDRMIPFTGHLSLCILLVLFRLDRNTTSMIEAYIPKL